jgi:acetyl-CoA acyltransferase
VGIAYGMGLTAEKVAQQWKVSREMQDAFRAGVAPRHQGPAGRRVHRRDHAHRHHRAQPDLATGESAQHPHRQPGRRPTPRHQPGRPGPSCARVRRARQRHGGNSSQTSDGAGALILASEKAVKQFGLTPLARFVSFAARGVPPEIMGIGPIEAIPAALRHAGLKQDDIGWIELNEAFAAQSLAVINTWA